MKLPVLSTPDAALRPAQPGAPAGDLSPPRLHGLPPVVDRRTRLVLLGSFPGVASLQAQQYYGHPRNLCWPLLGAILDLPLAAMAYEARLQALRRRRIGLWDVYASCRREGSLDSAIEAPQLNDFAALCAQAPSLRWVAHNGATSARATRHVQATGLQALRLPSSSPAHASWSFERKLAAWRAAFATAGLA